MAHVFAAAGGGNLSAVYRAVVSAASCPSVIPVTSSQHAAAHSDFDMSCSCPRIEYSSFEERRMTRTWFASLALAAVAALVAWCPPAAAAAAKNVILVVADGGGYNVWTAASMYQGRWDAARGRSKQVYDGPGWVAFGCSTYPLTTSGVPTETTAQDAAVVYDPAKAWDTAAEYQWLRKTATDSAAAATTLSTGRKTYNHAVNWDNLHRPLMPTMSEAAKAAGKAAGVITSVQWSHATPAGLSHAHAAERDDYATIANQMLDDGVLDVIMGTGNPDYDNDGQPVTKKKECKYVGGPNVWGAIEAARARPGGTYRGFRPVSTRAEFAALVSGPTPAKVLGTAQVGNTLQQARTGKKTADPATDTPLTATVPTLAMMTKGALNVLDENPRGFFLMVEGGAVDWANHNHQPGRMIQEQTALVEAIEAIVEWVNAHSNWQETLLVLTADHESGLLWGPRSDKVPFEPLVDHGPGVMPGLKYNLKTHTNSLVPVYAKGAGSELLAAKVVGQDPVRGAFVDNTGVGQVLLQAMGPAVQPPPSPPADRCVVLVSVDGLANFYLNDTQADMPTLRRLAREGARAQGMVSVFPTVTWPNHVALVTGATTAKTGVVGNSYLGRTTRQTVTLLCDPVFDKHETIKVPTVFDAVHQAGGKTAAICWPATRNATTLTYTVPDMGGDSWERYGTASWMDELRGEGIPVERQGPWVTEASGGVQRDWLYVRMATQVLQKHAVNLLLIHLVEPDHVQHRTGPRSPESYWCARYADDRIRELLEAIQHSKWAGKTTLLVCGDHGFFPVQKDIRPNVVLRKLKLLGAEAGTAGERAACCLSQGGGCAVYVFDAARRAEIVAQLQRELAKIEGVQSVLDPARFTKLGQPLPEREPRGADLWLAAKSGYSFADTASGDDVVVARKTTGGTHGYLPDQADMLAACVIWGPSVKPGTDLGKISILDIAPTVAALLGVKLPTADGKPLDKVLRPPAK
jgi:alkaline phosphatase/predicted AlkP superfamily pyrophosphatase or phosphodiesterase